MSNTKVPSFRFGESIADDSSYRIKERITPIAVGTSSNGALEDPLAVPRQIMPAVRRKVGLSSQLSGSFQLLQKWQGTVLSVDGDGEEFRAEITDKTTPSNPLEWVTISFDDLSFSDLPLLRKGAIFYWTIGYGIDKSGTKEKKSLLKFSRLKGFSKGDVEKAKAKAGQLLELFGAR
ncbi:MAG: hypothetical protein JKX92_13580 [Porticoccaceae bacterium]|nr:hypothetical protein [Porticoccaceae bacterium]